MSDRKRRFSRQAGEKALAAFLDRCDQVNANHDFMMSVDTVRLFGSFLDPGREPYGDLDLAVRLARRPVKGSWTDAALARFDQTGPRYGSLIDRLYWPYIEVWSFLKARSPRISIHEYDELDTLGCPSRLVYPREPEAEAAP